jgi:hypothetical protein
VEAQSAGTAMFDSFELMIASLLMVLGMFERSAPAIDVFLSMVMLVVNMQCVLFQGLTLDRQVFYSFFSIVYLSIGDSMLDRR